MSEELTLHEDHLPLMQKAQVYSRSKYVPKGYRNCPEDVVVAIEIGAELGMSPLGSLQNIHMIHGKACMPAEVQLALAIAHPDYAYHTVSSNEEIIATGICTMVGARKGWPEGVSQTVTYSVQEAKDAGLWGSTPSWKNHFADMVRARCTTRFVQIMFPDATKGITSMEHMTDAARQSVPAPKLKPEVVAAKMLEAEVMDIQPTVPVGNGQQVKFAESLNEHEEAEVALHTEAAEAGVSLWTKDEMAEMKAEEVPAIKDNMLKGTQRKALMI